jgi:hypothetical protein
MDKENSVKIIFLMFLNVFLSSDNFLYEKVGD